MDWGEGRDAVTDFVDRYGVDYPILLDPTLDTYYRWAGTDGLPRHYFIGAEGTVLREVIGPLDPSRMVAILEELLAWTVQLASARGPGGSDHASVNSTLDDERARPSRRDVRASQRK